MMKSRKKTRVDIPRVTTSSGPGTNQKSLQGVAVRTTVVFTYTVGGRAPRVWSAALAGRPRAFEGASLREEPRTLGVVLTRRGRRDGGA